MSLSLSHMHTHTIDEKVKVVIAGQSHKVARQEEGDQKWGSRFMFQTSRNKFCITDCMIGDFSLSF